MITPSNTRKIRRRTRMMLNALLVGVVGMSASAMAEAPAFGQSVRLDQSDGLVLTMRTLGDDELAGSERPMMLDDPDGAVTANWESELGTDFREQASDLFAPKAGTVGIKPGDLDGHFRGGALIDGLGRSSVLAYFNGSNFTPTQEMRALGVGVEPRTLTTSSGTGDFGDRFYTVSLTSYPTDGDLHTRLLISRHKPNGRLDPTFGNVGGGSPGYQFQGVWATWQGNPIKWTPLKALPVFQAASGTRPQYQRFVILGSVQLSETRRGYALFCLRVRPEQDRMEGCPGFNTGIYAWNQDFFQNDTSWTTDLDWVPGNPGQIVVAGQVRNNPANYQDLDFWVAKHSMGTGERMTSFGPNGERIYDIAGNSRDFVHSVKTAGSSILVAGNSAVGGSVQGSVIKVDEYNGTLTTSFCPAGASTSECGPTSVRAGKRLFPLQSGDTSVSVRAMDYRASRYIFAMSTATGKIRVVETDGNGKASCAALLGTPACRVVGVDGYVGVGDGGGGLAVLYNGRAVDLFSYNTTAGNNDSGVQMRHLVTSPNPKFYWLFLVDPNYASAGQVHTVDFPAFIGSSATKAARVARDSRGRYVVATTARYSSSGEFYNRVGIFRAKSDVIYDHSFDW